MIRSKKITQSARDEDCAMQSPDCEFKSDTVRWCHSNYGTDGKGTGIKSHDVFGFYGCDKCETWYSNISSNDQDRYWYFHRALKRSWLRLIEKGIITIK